MVEGRLMEMGTNPRNVQVVISRPGETSSIRLVLQDSDGTFMEVEYDVSDVESEVPEEVSKPNAQVDARRSRISTG